MHESFLFYTRRSFKFIILLLYICISTCIEVHIVNKYLFKKGLKYKGSAILIVSHVNTYKTLNSDSAVLKATAHSNQFGLGRGEGYFVFRLAYRWH